MRRLALVALLVLSACATSHSLPSPEDARNDAKASLRIATTTWKESTTTADNLCASGALRVERCMEVKKYSDLYRENALKAWHDLDTNEGKFQTYYQVIYDALVSIESIIQGAK